MLVHVAGWGATNERGRNPADALQKLRVCNSIYLIQKQIFPYIKKRRAAAAAALMQGGGIFTYVFCLFIGSYIRGRKMQRCLFNSWWYS